LDGGPLLVGAEGMTAGFAATSELADGIASAEELKIPVDPRRTL